MNVLRRLLYFVMLCVSVATFFSRYGPGPMLGRYGHTILAGERPCPYCGRPAIPHSYRSPRSGEISTYWYCPLHAPQEIKSYTGIIDGIEHFFQYLRIVPGPLITAAFYLSGVFFFLTGVLAKSNDWDFIIGGIFTFGLTSLVIWGLNL